MDLAALGVLIVVAWIVSRLVEAIAKPLWAKLKLDSFWLAYVALAIGVPLGLATGLNAFPVFAHWPWVGRAITAAITGLGPAFIYDLMDRGPTPIGGTLLVEGNAERAGGPPELPPAAYK